jgi:hypothetical protein
MRSVNQSHLSCTLDPEIHKPGVAIGVDIDRRVDYRWMALLFAGVVK